ncbi:hypothetical protein PUN28_004748 [Cardiocondyla obscurior]|uniref:Secreted protein n=1 Tax=Cardiocondyla obscurior TaxID=286306 RepID=A0AAW2GEB8_9HYME
MHSLSKRRRFHAITYKYFTALLLYSCSEFNNRSPELCLSNGGPPFAFRARRINSVRPFCPSFFVSARPKGCTADEREGKKAKDTGKERGIRERIKKIKTTTNRYIEETTE